jgi:hypothetical protein
MSSWWCISVFVVGGSSRIKEFEGALPSLFHCVAESDRVDGPLLAEVLQNYGGEAAIENAIAEYPDLIFTGTMIHEQAHPGDRFWGFTALDGETEWREFSLPDEERPMTLAEMQGRISCLDDKVVRLSESRDFYREQIRKCEARDKVTEPAFHLAAGDGSTPPRSGDEVRAIVAKVKAETSAKRG